MNQEQLKAAMEIQKEIDVVRQFLADENIVIVLSSNTVSYRCREEQREAILDMMHARLRELRQQIAAL